MPMLPGASGLSNFMKIILESQFPQSDLLQGKQFLDFLGKRGLRVSIEDLEYYDENGTVRPVLRLNRPLAKEGPMKYAAMMTDIFSMRHLFKQGWIELPRDDDFQPWQNYRDGYEDKTWLYYHPFQFASIRRLMIGQAFKLGPRHFKQMKDVQASFELMKESVERTESVSQKVGIESWIPRVGLLMLLEEAYRPHLGSLSINEHDSAFVEKWSDWRVNKFSPHEILTRSGMTVAQVKEVYNVLASEGHMVDPLASWYPLLRLIKRSSKS